MCSDSFFAARETEYGVSRDPAVTVHLGMFTEWMGGWFADG